MATFSAIKKQKQLGMPYGTASARLVKMLLFKMAGELDRTICYRCNTKILYADDLSIDHKENWLDVSTELFWDLNNIAFSHKKCNVPQRRFNRYSAAPEGTAWCGSCKQYVPTNRFSKKSTVVKGYSAYCYDCRKMKYGW